MELLRDKVLNDAYMVTKLINMLKRGELRLDHPQQRDGGQWNKVARDGLIVTLVREEDVDSIKICEQLKDNGVTLWVIDGKQRLSTIQMFIKGVFKLGRTIEFPIIKYQVAKVDDKGKLIKDDDGELTYDIVEFDMCGKGYDDLPDELKERIDNYKINVVKHLNCSDEEVGYHMRRYNRQTSMNAAQSGITFMDNTAKYVKDISLNSKFFRDCGCYTETEKRKGIADRVVVESIMAMFHLDNWKKNSKQIGTFVNEKCSKEEFDLFKEELHRLENVINKPIALFNSKNTFIWLSLFNKFCSLDIDDSKFVDFMNEFSNSLHYKLVDGQSFDDIDCNKGTKDKRVIEEKLYILESLMMEYLHISIEEVEHECIGVLEFIHENVSGNVSEDDVVLYRDMLNDFTLNVDNSSKLLNKENELSLLAIISYGCENDIDLDNWFIHYFKNNDNYILDQKLNYIKMVNNISTYIKEMRLLA